MRIGSIHALIYEQWLPTWIATQCLGILRSMLWLNDLGVCPLGKTPALYGIRGIFSTINQHLVHNLHEMDIELRPCHSVDLQAFMDKDTLSGKTFGEMHGYQRLCEPGVNCKIYVHTIEETPECCTWRLKSYNVPLLKYRTLVQ